MGDGKVIAIDGYSSCGKSTFAKLIAAKYSYVFIDTGAMYRTVTLYALRNNLENKELIRQLDKISISFRFNSELGRSEVYLGEENVDSLIRSVEINENVSRVAQIGEVRQKLVEMQRTIGSNGNGVVMDGRDIGTVVFPNADVKIFMTADVRVRAQRRYDELGGTVSLTDVERNISDRDFADENRVESPLRRAKDAIILDNSFMTLDEELEWFDTKFSSLLRS